PQGHQRVAQAALVGLGLAPDDPHWRTLLPAPNARAVERWRENGQWFVNDVAPWMTRRLRRRSSGDERTAKFPEPFRLPGCFGAREGQLRRSSFGRRAGGLFAIQSRFEALLTVAIQVAAPIGSWVRMSASRAYSWSLD